MTDLPEDRRSEKKICYEVWNVGSDIIFTQRGAGTGDIIRSGTWRGREGKFLLLRIEGYDIDPVLDDKEYVKSINIFEVDCTNEDVLAAVYALAVGISLHLAKYSGEFISYEVAEQSFIFAIDLFTDIEWFEWSAHANYELAAFYKSMGRIEDAIGEYKKAKSKYAAINDERGIAAVDNVLGLMALAQGESGAANGYFESALERRLAIGDKYYIASVLNNLGLVSERLGDLSAGLKYYENALEIFSGGIDVRSKLRAEDGLSVTREIQESGDLSSSINTLNNLAVLYDNAGEDEIAERYLRNATILLPHITNKMQQGHIRHNLAKVLLGQGLLDESLVLLSEAYEIFEAVQSPRWQGLVLTQLSQLYSYVGDKSSANKRAEQALALNVEDKHAHAAILRRRGELDIEAGRLEKAGLAYQKALNLYETAGWLFESAQTRSDLAQVYRLRGESGVALEVGQKAYEELVELKRDREVARALSFIGAVKADLGQNDEAEKALQKALEIHRETLDPFAELKTLDRLSNLYAKEKRENSAQFDRQAVKLSESLRMQALSPKRQAQFFSNQRKAFDRLLAYYFQQNDLESGWRVSEQARSRSLLDLRRQHKNNLKNEEIDVYLNRRAALVSELAKIRNQSVSESEAADALSQRQSNIELQLDEIDTRLRQATYVEPDEIPTLTELGSALDNDQALISYYLSADSIYLWLVKKAQQRVVRLDLPDDLDQQIANLIEKMSDSRFALGQVYIKANQLSDLLLKPVAGDLRDVTEILIMPDGPLASLPFSFLLLDPEKDELPLLATHIVEYLPSSVLLTEEKREINAQQPRMMVVANPELTSPSAAVAGYPEGSLIGQLVRSQGGRLLGAEKEMKAILGLNSGISMLHKVGAQATREVVINGGLSGYDYVHFATHGLVDLQYPMLSALLLADSVTSGVGYLRSHDIVGLNLTAKLVVLSGCDTGIGKHIAGEGALSLVRPFLIAGAEQVLSTLWKIDDARTAKFMAKFYHYLFIEKKIAAEALALTQRWASQQKELSHPYYWAGFVLTGNA
ncbi:MAG: CHAT domain-containing protein [Wenzhouxiangellaceae bacterium]